MKILKTTLLNIAEILKDYYLHLYHQAVSIPNGH